MMAKDSFGDWLLRTRIAKALLATVAGIGCLLAQSNAAQANAQAEDLYHRTEYRASLSMLSTSSIDPATNNLIGRDYFMMGDFKRAGDFFQKAVAENPASSDYALWLGRAWGRRAETANPLFAPGYASKARQWLEKSVQLDNRNSEALSDLFDYYLDAPGFLGGGYDKAEAIASKMSAADPAEGYFARAKLAEKRNQYDNAEVQLRHAMQIAPRQVGKVLALAKFLSNQGRVQESDALYAKAEKMAPEAPQVWYAHADALIKQKRNPEEAKRLLEKYLHSGSITADDPPKEEAERLLKRVSGGA